MCLVHESVWTCDSDRGSDVALSEETLLLWCESTDDTVENAAVVEENAVAFLPVMGVDELWVDTWTLQSVDEVADFSEVVHSGAVGADDRADGGGVDD